MSQNITRTRKPIGFEHCSSTDSVLKGMLVVARQIASSVDVQNSCVTFEITNAVGTGASGRMTGATLQTPVNNVGNHPETGETVCGRVDRARGPRPGHDRVAGGLIPTRSHPEPDGGLPGDDRVGGNGPRIVQAVEADRFARRDVLVVPENGEDEKGECEG